LTEAKKVETRLQIEELLNQDRKALYEMLEKASTSGALDSQDEVSQLGNYRLAKYLITIYFDKRPYAPISGRYDRELANLEGFL
jgi:hypothetical protein